MIQSAKLLTAAIIFASFQLVPAITGTVDCKGQANEPGSGNALDFDGTDDYMEVPDHNSLDIIDSLTISVWVKLSAITNQSVITKYDGGPDPESWAISGKSDGEIQLYIGSSGTDYSVLKSNDANLAANEWYHIAATYKANGSEMKLYLNGNLLNATRSDFGSGAGTIWVTTVPVLFGGTYEEPNTPVSPFSGNIDEVRIWNRLLSQAEIRENMCKKLTGIEPGLVGYWRFDEGSGSTAFDSSSNSNNGTLQ